MNSNTSTQSGMEYVWFPLLQPRISESEFGHLSAMGSPEADYANWQGDRLRRIERGTPKSDEDVIIDSVLRCPIATVFNVAYTTHMNGWPTVVQEARLNMLSSRERMVVVSTVQAPRDFLFTNTLELREFVAERLGQVQSSSGTEITFLTDSNMTSSITQAMTQEKSANEQDMLIEELVTVQIRGAREDVNTARTQLLVLLDQCAGFDCDRFESVTLLQQYATAGPNFTNIVDIMRKTSTKIYFSSPLGVHSKLPHNSLPGWENRIEKSDNALYITGLRPNIETAKALLLEAANLRIISSTVTLSPRKLEWILLTQSEFIHSVMCRCGVFIAFPPLGSSNNFTTIYGTELNLVFKAVRDIASIACEFHEIFISVFPTQGMQKSIAAPGVPSSGHHISHHLVRHGSHHTSHLNNSSGGAPGSATSYGGQSYSLHTSSGTNSAIGLEKSRTGQQSVSVASSEATVSQALRNVESLLSELGQISESTGAEIYFSENLVCIYGPNNVVSPALTSVINCNYFQRFRNTLAIETEIRVELAQKHEEFLKGKHCGKIKKLVQGSHVRYTFEESLTESNVLIRVFSPIRYETASAYHNLSLELPVEMSLYIPETEHHKMIGEKGRNSQKLSTKYHAFLRFSSKMEQTEIGGYFKLNHNVFALTPAKYSTGFESLLADLVGLYLKVCIVPSITVSLPHSVVHPTGINNTSSFNGSLNDVSNDSSSIGGDSAVLGSSPNGNNAGCSINSSSGSTTGGRFARDGSRFTGAAGSSSLVASSSNQADANYSPSSLSSGVTISGRNIGVNGSSNLNSSALKASARSDGSPPSDLSTSGISLQSTGTTLITTAPLKCAQTICEVLFPHRFLHFFFPCVSEIETKHSVRIRITNCEFGSDLVQFFGTHAAINDAIADVAGRCAPQSICIETGISSSFVEARFASGVDMLVDHLMDKFSVMLAVSLAPAKCTVMFRFTAAPEKAESLAPCCMMTIDYFSDQLLLPAYGNEEDTVQKLGDASEQSVASNATLTVESAVSSSPGLLGASMDKDSKDDGELASKAAAEDATVENQVGHESAANLLSNASNQGSDKADSSDATSSLTSGSFSLSTDVKKVVATDSPQSTRSIGSHGSGGSSVSAAEASFQYFDARVYSGILPTLLPRSPLHRNKANMMPTPEGCETETSGKTSTISPSQRGDTFSASVSSEGGSIRKASVINTEAGATNPCPVPRRSGSITVRDLWNAFQKTPDSGRLVSSLAGIDKETYELISPATAAELPFRTGSAVTSAAGSTGLNTNNSGVVNENTSSESKSQAAAAALASSTMNKADAIGMRLASSVPSSTLPAKKPAGLSIVNPGKGSSMGISTNGSEFGNDGLETAALGTASGVSGVMMASTGTNTEVGDGPGVSSAVDDVEIHRGMPKKRRMSLLSPTPASRTSPPARLQPPRKVNLDNFGEKDDNLEKLQIRELTSNMSKFKIATPHEASVLSTEDS